MVRRPGIRTAVPIALTALLGACADSAVSPMGPSAVHFPATVSASTVPTGAVCEVINFDNLQHGDYVTQVAVPGFGLTLDVSTSVYTLSNGAVAGQARAFDTDHLSGSDNEGTDMEWKAPYGRCADCNGLGRILMVQRYLQPGDVLDNNYGGLITFTGFPAGEFFVRSVTIVDNDTPPPVVTLVDGNVVASSIPGADGSVQTVQLPQTLINTSFAVERGTPVSDRVIASGGLDNIEVCRIPDEPPPPPPTGACDGKVSTLTLRYTGNVAARITIVQNRGKVGQTIPAGTTKEPIAFDAVVQPGAEFTVNGLDNKATLGPNISIYIDNQYHTFIHTSCSQPIGPGLVRGLFTVTAGASRNGGALAPVAPDAQD